MNGHTPASCNDIGRAGIPNDLRMGSHASMMHYALSDGKCLLHHAINYVRWMPTPNQRLMEIRARRYSTAVEAAAAIGVNKTTYIQHENATRGTGSIPRAAAERYAKFFKVSLDWLLTGKGDGDPQDAIPSEDELREMIRLAIDVGVKMETRLVDLPHIVAPALREQLERFQAGLSHLENAGKGRDPDKGAPPREPTRPDAQA